MGTMFLLVLFNHCAVTPGMQLAKDSAEDELE